MRTKTDKDRKKAASQRLQFNVSLPSVVLDASDCTKLLDGPGKTSVIVVEKDGKIVPATSFPEETTSSSFSPSLSSSSSKSPSASLSPSYSTPSSCATTLTSGTLTSKPKLCKSPSSTPHCSASENPPKITATPIEGSTLSNYVSDSTSPDKSKMILKPPKKRRGNDKGVYEDLASSSVLNGEMAHQITSPLRDVPRGDLSDIALALGSSSSSLIVHPLDLPQKHTIENLLQSPTNNNSSSSNNKNLVSGKISHRPYESFPHQSSHSATTAGTSVHSPLSKLSTLQTPLPSLSATSTAVSPSQPSPITHSSSGIAYLGPTHQEMTTIGGPPSHLYSASSQTPVNQPAEIGPPHLLTCYIGSSEAEQVSQPSTILPPPSLSPPPASKGIHQPTFQPLPEQDEPINLSTSSKSTAPSPLSLELTKDTELSEQVLHSPTMRSGSNVHISNSVSQTSLDSWEGNPNVCSKTEKLLRVSREHHLQEDNITNSVIPHRIQGLEDESSKIRSFVDHLPSAASPCQSQNQKLPPLSEKSTDEASQNNLHNNEEPEPIRCQATSSASDTENNGDDSDKSSIPLSQLSISCAVVTSSTDVDSAVDKSEKISDCDKETGVSDITSSAKADEKTAHLKCKKPPKKRIEVPMDEGSCADRLARYTGSIDCVITDFEFNPEPAEEISLTLEEEAIIREQFEDSKANKDADKNIEDEKPLSCVSKSIDTSDLEKEYNEEIPLPLSRSGDVKDTPVDGKNHIAKPPKKRANAGKNAHPKKASEAVLMATANMESVLSFVVADITNYTPPSEEGMAELDEKYGHILRKKKKKVDPESENNQEKNSMELENNASSPDKKRKIVENLKTVSSQSEDVLVSEKPAVEQHSVSTSTLDLTDEEEERPAKTPIAAKAKPKVKVVKEAKKRKADLRPETKSNVSKPEKEKPPTEDTSSKSPVKKKKVEGKTKAQKKKKTDKKKSISNKSRENTEDEPNEEKYSLTTVKMETSDLGESIASVSGGSEQVTPVHELETRDEGTNTDQCTDKENNDTGAESCQEEKEKPVRHYKRRLEFVKCSQCDHQARGRSALSRHMKKIHLVSVDMPYKCTLCPYGCTKMASLNRHLFTHGIFPCSRCDYKTDERDKLTEHIAEQHKDKLDMKLCKVCNRYIKCESVSIEEHSDKCQGPTPYKCTECEKEFKYGSSLRVHYHTHFPNEPKRFKCELCDYRTNYKANLHKHHKNMHASKDRDIQCPDCGKMFSTEDNMRRHRKVHTLARPFACETCKKTFKTSGALKGHQLIHTATRPFTCNIPGCNRSFRTAKFLKSHQEEFHRLVPKKFFCLVEGCNYSFFKRSHLKRHAITHTGERNFHCTWPGCCKSFRHADNLKVHFRSHTNEKPIQCHLCDFKCKQKNSLFWHKKKVHQIVDASTVVTKRSSGDHIKDGDLHIKKEASISSDALWLLLKQEDSAENSVASSIEAVNGDVKREGKTGCEKSEELPKGVGDNKEKSKPQTNNRASKKSKECGPADMYEFKSDDESEEEGISPLRRENIRAATITPLPPPPKELLLKNEMQEQKEREKHEKEERKEQEKKEKADKKEQEKREKAEKKEKEKLEKAEKKEKEKKEIAEKKEEKKKEYAEKKELEKKQKDEKREQEKKEKQEQKLQEKEEKLKKKETEKKEKERKRIEVKRLKLEARKVLQRGSALLKKKKVFKLKREVAQLAATKPILSSKEKKSKTLGLRRKLPGRGRLPAMKPKATPKKPGPGRGRKKKGATKEESASGKANPPEEDVTIGASTRRRGKALNGKASSKEEKPQPSPRSSSPRAASKKPSVQKKTVSARGATGGKATKAASPKRKHSARIKANNKVALKSKKATKVVAAKKTTNAGPKKKPGRKKGSTKATAKKGKTKKEEEEEEEEEVEEEGAEGDEEDENIVEGEEEKEDEIVSPTKAVKKIAKEKDSVKSTTRAENKEKSQPGKDEEEQVPSRPTSPAYSEEIMLQGKASPYRDFSDAEDIEEESEEKDPEPKTPQKSPEEEEFTAKTLSVSQNESSASEEGNAAVDNENNSVDQEEAMPESPRPEEDSSDDEVSNDIPLTPPRAPAPPPMESSEDEMEPELDNSGSEPCQQPFSVPAPSTPFSVPGPNTPFSVPPPTNLMQQHSVHSEELPSVASMEMPSVETQQATGSVELHPHGSAEMHPHGSVEMHPHGSVEMHPHGSVEMHPHGSVEMHPHGSVEMHPHGSVEMHSHGSAEKHPHGSVEMHPHGSVEMHPHGSVEMHSHGSAEKHPHGSVEMHPHGSVEMHPHGSVEMHPHGSVEMHPHGSVEMHPHGSVEMHPHGSVEMHPHGSVEMHPHGSVEMHPHGSVEMHTQRSVELHPHGSVEMHPNGSVEMNQSHGSVEMQLSHSSISEPLSQAESQMPPSNLSVELPATPREVGPPAIPTHHDKYGLSPVLEDGQSSTEADKKCFDQYLKNLNMAHSNLECSPPSGLQQLEAMVDKSHSEDLLSSSKSPQISNHHHQHHPQHPAMPTSVITSLETSLPHMPQPATSSDIRSRIDPLATERHHHHPHPHTHPHESLYPRDTVSVLPRLPDRQTATPSLLTNHATPTPAFDAFSTLNPLHPSPAGPRDNAYLRQQETAIFATPPATSSFMAEAAMFQRQAMTTPFLPPPAAAAQPGDRSSLSRISDPASSLRSNSASSLLRRPTTVPGTEMFPSSAVSQTMPRHPFPNVWPGQEMRASTHWQNPYLPRQPNMGHAANSPFFPPTKENYLTGREFMLDPSSVRSSTERSMFSTLSSSSQTAQDSFQMDRYDISNYFPNAMTPYGSSTAAGTLDYTRSTHSAAPKPFDERYRQTAAASAAAAAIPDFRGLPPTTAAPEMFPSIGMNSGFNLYTSNPMSYHPQHMTDNVNSAFLAHSSSAQQAMLERDYAAAAAHRSLYPHHHHHHHQNATYPFIDERQYSGTSKLTASSHPAATGSATQDGRDLMSRSAATSETHQMQDPYRSMLYRY